MIRFNANHATTMRDIESLRILESSCTPTEARDVATSLVQCASNFHKMQNLKSLTHTECCDVAAMQSLERLEAVRVGVSKVAARAREEGRDIRVRISFDIELGAPKAELSDARI